MAIKNRKRTTKTDSKAFEEYVGAGDTTPPEDAPTEPAAAPSPAEPSSAEAPAQPQKKAPAPKSSTAKSPRSSRKKGPSGEDEQPEWVRRANAAKKTEAQPFRYNVRQNELLAYAKQVEGRDYSKILADLVWPALEEKYGAEVPFDEE